MSTLPNKKPQTLQFQPFQEIMEKAMSSVSSEFIEGALSQCRLIWKVRSMHKTCVADHQLITKTTIVSLGKFDLSSDEIDIRQSKRFNFDTVAIFPRNFREIAFGPVPSTILEQRREELSLQQLLDKFKHSEDSSIVYSTYCGLENRWSARKGISISLDKGYAEKLKDILVSYGRACAPPWRLPLPWK